MLVVLLAIILKKEAISPYLKPLASLDSKCLGLALLKVARRPILALATRLTVIRLSGK
jgi:polynucleotide 5'-kinase involved in rRNA processing